MSAQLLTCFHCKKIQKSIQDLIVHVRFEKKLPYKCTIPSCFRRSFGNVESLRSHLNRHQLKGDFSELLDEETISCELPVELSKFSKSVQYI